jgi:adenosylcobinamide-phosphate synthase
MKPAAWTIAGAAVLDWTIGDPPAVPHPVRAIGAAIAFGDARFNREGSGSRLAGGLVALAVVLGAAGAGALAARRRIGAVVAAASTLATHDLVREARAVARALEAGSLADARSAVARIVGRDTHDLDATDVARAAIETLAESACDGIVAPLFWLALGGVPAAFAFKAASTLDSMIGHRTPRHERFGCVAARLDDAANFVPARVTALLIAFAGARPLATIRAAMREAATHASPNAGWPESALATALGVRLGGTNRYAGVTVAGPVFNPVGRAPDVRDLARAIAYVRRVSLLATLIAVRVRA